MIEDSYDHITKEIWFRSRQGRPMSRGLFYEEVQHAFDYHQGAYYDAMDNLSLHAVTAENIKYNPLLPTTAADNVRLGNAAAGWR